MSNPYESPKHANPCRNRRHASLLRGLSAGLVLAPAGYLLPLLLLPVIGALRYGVTPFPDGIIPYVTAAHAGLKWDYLGNLAPSLACTLLFGLTGVVNYTPAHFPGLLRTMMRVGVATLLGVAAMVIATLAFDLGPQSRTSDPYALLRLGILAFVPLVYAIRKSQANFQSSEQEADGPAQPVRE